MRFVMFFMVLCFAVGCGGNAPAAIDMDGGMDGMVMMDGSMNLDAMVTPDADVDAGVDSGMDSGVVMSDAGMDSGTDAGMDSGTLPVCGNGIVESGEGCDDGNAVTESCAYGLMGCTVCTSTCQNGPGIVYGYCGDGQTQTEEACDDHNTVSGDGCESDCLSLTRWVSLNLNATSCTTGVIYDGTTPASSVIITSFSPAYCTSIGGTLNYTGSGTFKCSIAMTLSLACVYYGNKPAQVCTGCSWHYIP